MLRMPRVGSGFLVAAIIWVFVSAGCTPPAQYVRNGFKVGPNYERPPAPVAQHWIDASDAHIQTASPDLSRWWGVFNDPILNRLVDCAYQQNLTLRQAGFRVLEARAQLAIAKGELFPQTQQASGAYQRVAGNSLASSTPSPAGKFFNNWNYGFNLAWELDFWGRLRRAITAGEDNLDASVANYDQVLVTMLGDIAQNYVEIRTDQEQIKYLRANVKVQQLVFNYFDARLKAGYKVSNLDWGQAKQTLKQTEAQIPPLETDARQAANRLCTLLGIPASDLEGLLGTGPIPTVPPTVAIGIPAELVRRRPDVRQAERLAAAQAEQIGIAEAQLYPIFSITGVLNWQAQNFKDLFTSNAFNGSVGPQFQWALLNYGRIHNNILFQDATFKQLVVAYQAQVLQASQDVENGIVTFLKAQVQTKLLQESVQGADVAEKAVLAQFKAGEVDVNRYATIEQALVTEQNALAQAQGQIAQGLILMYRGLGGGWEIRCQPDPSMLPLPATPPNPLEMPKGQPGAPADAPNQLPEEIPAPAPPPNPLEMPKEQPALPADPAGKLPQPILMPAAPTPEMK